MSEAGIPPSENFPKGSRLRQLLDVSVPRDLPSGAILLWDPARGKWVPRVLSPADIGAAPASHRHAPGDIAPQGSGSGLDADTVDGQHATAFASAAHNHDATYVKKSGDTMTGQLSIDTGTAGSNLLQVKTSSTTQYSTAGLHLLHQAPAAANRDFRLFVENSVAGGGGDSSLFLRHNRGTWPDARNILVYRTSDEALLLGGSNLYFVQAPKGAQAGSGTTQTVWHSGNHGPGSGLDADTVDGQHASAFAPATHVHPDATPTSSGFMSATDKTKLDGIQAGAQVNQNAFSSVKVGSTTVSATAQTDTLELVAGSNVTLTPDATNKRITIAASSGTSAPGYGVVKVGTTNVSASAPNDTLTLAAGSNVVLTPDTATKQVTVGVSPQGSGSGLHADLLDTYHAGNGSNQIPVSNGTVCTNLNADLLDGVHASALQNQNAFSNVAVGSTTIGATSTTDTLTLAAGSNVQLSANTSTKTVTIAVSPQGSGSNLHADLLDGYHAGNSSGQVPVSNGTLCTNLNADLVDGLHASSFLQTSGGTITGNLTVTGYVLASGRPFLFRGKTTSQSIAASTTTTLTWPNAISQVGPGTWGTDNATYTVSVAGLYLISVAVLLNAASGGGRVSLRVKKGTTEYFIYDQNIDTTDYVLAAGQILLPCNAGDTIQVTIWCGTSRSTYAETTAGTMNRLQICLIG